jgi:hypothetical protein
MMYAYDFIRYFTPEEGNQYLNDLFWVIYFQVYNARLTISHYELIQCRHELEF